MFEKNLSITNRQQVELCIGLPCNASLVFANAALALPCNSLLVFADLCLL